MKAHTVHVSIRINSDKHLNFVFDVQMGRPELVIAKDTLQAGDPIVPTLMTLSQRMAEEIVHVWSD